MLWKRKKDKEIVFWCDLKGLPDIVPVKESKHFIPEWFKKAPAFEPGSNELIDLPTVKRCPGFIEFFKVGYVVPAWCDFYIDINEDGATVKTPNDAFPVNYHHPNQFAYHLPEHAKKNVKLTFKPACPWKVKTPKGVKMLALPMSHHHNPDFYTVTGLLDTHIFHELNPIWIFMRTGKFFVKRGTPLAMFVPVRTENFDLVVREETTEDVAALGKQIYAISSVFNSKFRKYEKITEDKK